MTQRVPHRHGDRSGRVVRRPGRPTGARKVRDTLLLLLRRLDAQEADRVLAQLGSELMKS